MMTAMLRATVAMAGLTLLADPALAQGGFALPQGCQGVLTVQLRSCLVSNIWTCDGDAPGHQWVALFSETGPWQIRLVDDEFQWLETYFASPPKVETMQVPAPDPESLTELFATRNDSYDFTVTSDDGAAPERFVGYDRLTGESVVIDGEPLLRTEYAYDTLAPDGTVLYSGAGRQYVSERHRLFFFGKSWEAATPDAVTDARPVEFIYPGEPGFMTSAPRYDCGAVLSKSMQP